MDYKLKLLIKMYYFTLLYTIQNTICQQELNINKTIQ
jgi:hypothetical protein